ncbi:MAG: YicC/YloC family endoribonuclease [Planctomycetota bacterium]
MIRSMTGFGDAATQHDGVHYAVELRSLNNRYFKCTSRLPDELAGLEAELEVALRKRFARGSFSVAAKLRVGDDTTPSEINDDALLDYVNHLEALKAKLPDSAVTIDLTHLLALPGVLSGTGDAPQLDLVERARPVVLQLVQEASDKLVAMRQVEGQSLAVELREQAERLLTLVGQIEARAPHVVEEYHARLSQRVGELMAKAQLQVSEPDLIKEIAVFADRCDIREELTRLRGHLEQFETVIAADDGEPAGRTLDFLAQEMLREANTIGSKSNDADISQRVVQAKSIVDRIKEQVQNVE